MALTELQLPDKSSFYQSVQSVAGESISRYMRWKNFSDFIQNMTGADMDTMGIPSTGDLRAHLSDMREALDAMITNFETAQVGTTGLTAQEILERLRRPLIL